MPSIHPGFEYDIFISYRQNDNRSDKWVSNFVEALKEELEATLKNPISIYFDENPHDGLLDTHQVDASLAKKLKCLVFMPIISQTYCDETSFAWEHEFMPFINMAKRDKLGMNITLSNGNVVSRVLPVKIHRLDSDDQNTLEAVLDGPLRSIDFIYQEAGVNRPLKPDDERNLNLEKTDYQNQINKVANALKDIGLSIIKKSDVEITLPIPEREKPVEVKSSNKGIYIGLAIIIIALLAYWGYKKFYNSPIAEAEDITIAVLAFDDQSPDGDQEWLGDGMADEILNVLAKVNGLQVTGKTSSFSFKGKGFTTKKIGKTLNVSTVLEGSVSKIGHKLRITAQLIDVETDAHIWSKKYDRDAADIFNIIDEVAQSIAGSLRSELSLEDLQDVKVAYEVDPEAYEYYLKGVYFHWSNFAISGKSATIGGRKTYFRQSEKMFIKAISIDSAYAEAYAGLADLYDSYASLFVDTKYDLKRDSIINIGYKINPNSAYILAIKGLAYTDTVGTFNLDSAFYYLKRAYLIDSTNTIINNVIAEVFGEIGLHDNAIAINSKILLLDPLNIYVRNQLAKYLIRQGMLEKGKEECKKILEIDNTNLSANMWMFILALNDKDEVNVERLKVKLQKISPGELELWRGWLSAFNGNQKEALELNNDIFTYSLLDMKEAALSLVDSAGVANKYTGLWTYNNLKNVKVFEFIWDNPAYQKILAKSKKVHEERVAKYGHLFDKE